MSCLTTPTLILNPNQTYLINKRSSVFITNSLSVIKHFWKVGVVDDAREGFAGFRPPYLLGMVWYGVVTLFTHGISFRYIYIQIEKTNYLTKLESKVKD